MEGSKVMAMFAKRHYEVIAKALKATAPQDEITVMHTQWVRDVQELSQVFKADNGAFDYARFRKACGLD